MVISGGVMGGYNGVTTVVMTNNGRERPIKAGRGG